MRTVLPAHGRGAEASFAPRSIPARCPRGWHTPLQRPRTALCASKGEEPDREEIVLTEDDTRLLNCIYEPQRVGAEYGEGFVQLRMSGESLHLDVDTLNERLQLNGAARMRTAMKPDEAFGMIFCWDGVLVDTRTMQRRAWQQLAAERGLPFPAMERPLYDIRPERVITDVLQWSRDWRTTQTLSTRFAQLLAGEFRRLDAPLPGVEPWLAALHKANVPCAVITTLARADMRACLERMGLERFFHAEVTAEDGMETLAQRYLSAAIKLARPPRSCVVFDATPGGITAAHNCTMKVWGGCGYVIITNPSNNQAVAVRSVHKGHHLKAADLTCAAMSELSVYNVRRLFSNTGAEFMDYAKLTHHQATRGHAAPRRLLRNATIDIDPDEQDEGTGVVRC